MTPTSRRALAVFALGFALSTRARPAAAQPRAAACRDADRTIDQALELRRRGRDEAALDALSALWTRCPSPRLRAQIGLAEEALHRWLDAHAHLREALAAADDPWIASRRAALDEVRLRAFNHLARVDPQPAAPGAELWTDGRRVGALPLPEALVVAAGEFQFELRRGVVVTPMRRTLREGEWWRDVVGTPAAPAVTTAPAPIAPPVARATPHGNARRTVGISLIAVGAAALVGAAVTWTLSFAQQSDADGDVAWQRYYHRALQPMATSVDDACARAEGDASPDAAHARELCADNARLRTLTLAFGLGGAVLAGAGAVLWATAPASSEGPRARLAPMLSPRAQGAVLTVDF